MSRRQKADWPVEDTSVGEHGEDQERRPPEALGRHQRQVLERREVLQPLGQPEQVAEEHHHDGEHQRQPGQRGQRAGDRP